MRTFIGFVLGVAVCGVVAIAAFLIYSSPNARLVTVKQAQSYEDWCWGKGGSVNYNSVKYYIGCTVPPKGVKQ